MDSFVTEAFTLLAVGIIIVGLRTYARWSSVGLQGLKFDDYLMLFAVVVYSLETATAYAVGAWWQGLANNGMTTEQRETLEPNSPEWNTRVGGSKTQLVGWSLYTLLLWLLKLCMCGFYSRLTEGVDNMAFRIKIGYVTIAVTYVATELSILLGCQPFYKNWQINPDPGNYCQPAISKIDLYVTVVLNVVTDMYLLSIPLPLLWRARLPFRRRILLLVLFGGGVFVMMAGILRCVLILRDPIGGAQQAGSWAVRETFVAVVVGNIAMIYPIFRRYIRVVSKKLGFASSNDRSDEEPRQFEYDPSQERSRGTNKKKKFSTLYPLTTMDGTMIGDERTASQERIVGYGRSDKDTPTLGSERSVALEDIHAAGAGKCSGGPGSACQIKRTTVTVVEHGKREVGDPEIQDKYWPLQKAV